jgi:hypothetical protein
MASISRFLFGSRIRLSLTIVAVLVGLYALTGFLIVPWLAKPRIEKAVSELLGRETHLERLKLNPFKLSGTMEGFEIVDLDGEPLLSFSYAHANIQALSYVFKSEYHLKELDLKVPYFRFQISKSGSLNIADILNQITKLPTEEVGTESEPKPVKIDTLKIIDGSISVTDLSHSAPFSSVIAPINFDISGFHTSGESDAPYAFSATSESGESFSWEGFVALEPLRSKGSFKVNGLSMPKYEPFYDIILKTDIVDGTIGVNGKYEYSSGDEGVMKLVETAIAVENVEVINGETKNPVLAMELGQVSGVNVDYLTQTIEIESIKFKNGSIHAKRQADGQIDLINLIEPQGASPEPEEGGQEFDPSESTLTQASYHMHSLELDGFSIDLLDEAAPTPASFALDDVSISATDIRSVPGSDIPLLISANVRSGGAMTVSGTVSLQPVSADLDLEVGNLELKAGNPYLPEFADVQITSGHVNLSGHASVNLAEEKPVGEFHGNFQLSDLKIVESELGQDLVDLTVLKIEGIETVLEPMAFKVETISLLNPRASILVNEDSTINLLKALRIEQETTPDESGEISESSDPPAVESSDSSTGLKIPFPISIGSIVLENVGAVLTDRSISPVVNLGLETLSGTVSGLSSEELARADLDLHGTLIGGTQMAIKGKINPLIEDRYSDIEMTFKDFNLTAVSPYSGKYAGYKLSKGKLSFDLKYKVSQSELSGENIMVLDQLNLGDKVESEDALKLPIPLAVSLMKDRNGVINIDVPVSGNLNDPKFSFGRVISQAIVNVLTKLITSPFSMLGGLIPGGKDVDLSMVSFAPAEIEFDDDTQKKLNLLADALKERPNLSLEIVGAAGGAAEVIELKKKQLEENLRTLRWREQKNEGNTAITLKEVILTQSEHERLTTLSFNLMFPDETFTITTAQPDTASFTNLADEETESIPAPEETTKVETAEQPKALAGFFRRIFGGSTNSSNQEIETAPSETPTASTEIVEAQSETAEPDTELEVHPIFTIEQMESITITEDDLHQIAAVRAEAVRAHLESTGDIAAERLFVVESEDPGKITAEAGEPQVIFNLE